MRKFSRGNKKEFVFFTFVVGLIITVFIVGLLMVFKVEKVEYAVTTENISFDAEYNLIGIENDGTISKEWNQNYYLKVDNEETNLGKNAIYFEKSRNRLSIYGDSFEVVEGGDVYKYIQENSISDLKKDRLIKLSDRKYIVVGDSIRNESGSIDTIGFLMVNLDQSGNTMLINNELNMNTINPLKLQTDDFTFDVANERLIFEFQEIDLKKVIGSTNKYIEIRPTNSNSKNNGENNDNELQDGTNEDGKNNNNNNNNEQDERFNDYDELVLNAIQAMNDGIYNRNKQQASQTQQVAQQTQQTSQQTSQTSVSQSKITLSKNISLRSVTPGSTYMNVEYSVVDPENRYQTVYLDIQGNVQRIISLDKTQNHYVVTGLAPDTEYTVTLGCKEIMEDSSIEDKIEDTMIVKTAKVKESLTITKVARGKIYFTYKMDSDYAYSSGRLALYIDGEKDSALDINVSEALTTTGWKSYFRYSYGNEITLKLEDTIIDGSIVNTKLQTKVKFY